MRNTERGSRPEMREDKGHGLTEKEVTRVTGMVDMQKYDFDVSGELEKVDADNVERIVDEGAERIRQERRKDGYITEDMGLSEAFYDHNERASRLNHAIQCSANKEVELELLLARATAAYAEAGEEFDADAEYANDVLSRQLEMNAVMSEVFVADVIRRIATRKEDEDMMKIALERFNGIRPRLKAALKAFEEAQPTKIEATPNLPTMIEALHKDIDMEEGMEKLMYDDIALPFSEMIGYDMESFNEQELMETLQDFERSRE